MFDSDGPMIVDPLFQKKSFVSENSTERYVVFFKDIVSFI